MKIFPSLFCSYSSADKMCYQEKLNVLIKEKNNMYCYSCIVFFSMFQVDSQNFYTIVGMYLRCNVEKHICTSKIHCKINKIIE
jgi:hypothetical protein